MRRPLQPRLARWAFALACACTLGAASAHATLVFGDVAFDPDPPRPGQPLQLTLELEDPTEVPVEDALVHVEARPLAEAGAAADAPADAEEAPPSASSDPFEEVAPGRYQGSLVLPEAGRWALRFRDQTFRQEEATASITVTAGADAEAQGTVSFVFPPTATDQGLGVWLLWLIGVPLLVGVVVTVWVLRRPTENGEPSGEGADADGDIRR